MSQMQSNNKLYCLRPLKWYTDKHGDRWAETPCGTAAVFSPMFSSCTKAKPRWRVGKNRAPSFECDTLEAGMRACEEYVHNVLGISCDVITPEITLTLAEIAGAASNPECLDAIAQWHDLQATYADGCDMRGSADYHTSRMRELQQAAEKIREEWES